MTRLLEGLDISKLSPRSRATLILISDPVEDGWKETELASQLGRTPSWVSERLSELRTEILLQNGLFPPLTDAEDAALRDSIRAYGVIEPVLVDENLDVISGSNRLRITRELDKPCPMLILRGLDPEAKRELTIMLNATRRQLSRQQKRKLIEHELMHDSNRSDRRIAAICGVTHSTVGAVRREIADSAQRWRELELPIGDAPAVPADSPSDIDVDESSTSIWQHDNRRIDTLGRRNPTRTRAEPRARIVTTIECPCCQQPLELWRTGNDYHLQHPDTAAVA